MNQKIPSDIEEAVSILESLENSINHSEKMRDFEDAMDILKDYIKDDDYKHIHAYAKNIRKTYTRKLLEELPSFPSLQMNEWFNYIKILLLNVCDEVETITKENPSLRENEINFLNIWGDEVVSILKAKLMK